jgi:hypothetical protein
MARIIPGVQVQVVKEVLPPQLSPSGVLGLVGLTEKNADKVVRASSLSRFVETLGPGTAVSMPEARQALANGVFELIVSPVTETAAEAAQIALNCTLKGSTKLEKFFTLAARVKGTWADDIVVNLKSRQTAAGKNVLDLTFTGRDGGSEIHRNLTFLPGKLRYIADVLDRESSLLKTEFDWSCDPKSIKEIKGEALTATSLPLLELEAGGQKLPLQIEAQDTGDGLKLWLTLKKEKQDDKYFIALTITSGTEKKKVEILKREKLEIPKDLHSLMKDLDGIKNCKVTFEDIWLDYDAASLDSGMDIALKPGKDENPVGYTRALERLINEPDVDMVLAAVQDFNGPKATQVYSEVISHCERMSDDCKGRIGFGQVGSKDKIENFTEMASKLISDRFVLIAPHGVAGAVSGMIGSLQYFRSPTFKRLAGISNLSLNLGVEDQRTLLKSHLLPVVIQRERGTIVLHGLTTDGDQISVRRVADRAVRGVKRISELFIGRLNNEDGRGALKQKLIEFLIQMEKDGAIVPSTDGTDPAYKIDVYSSQADFAQGIVRVDLAVRPVRAIDYIYATILVQV